MDKKNLSLTTKIADPKWIFFVISIPQFILFIILTDNYNIIKTELTKYENRISQVFGIVLLLQAILYSIYALIRIFQNKKVHKILPVIILVSYIGYLYAFCVFAKNCFFDIPTWIISIWNILLVYGTFTIPAFFYALFLGERILSSKFETKKIWINFIFILIIPTLWYFFFKLLDNNNSTMDYRIFFHAMIFAFIITTLCFFFFLLRMIIALYKKNYTSLKKLQLLWTILFALILPILGLLLNECYFPFSFLRQSEFKIQNFHEVFGEFNNILFFILALLNGILLCLPSLNNKTYRIFLFIFRSILFIFTLYFFIVFIPFIPFFIFSIIIFGLGVFLITPLILLIIHFKILKDDIKYLSNFLNIKKIVLLCSLSILLIPSIITTIFFIEKNNLFKALNYVYYPDFQKKKNPKINLIFLNKTLNNITKIKINNNLSRGIPYITQYYNKIVLNNLTLSDDKINYLSQIFLNEKTSSTNDFNRTRETPKQVIINNIIHKTEYDTKTKLYHTWIDLELENITCWRSEFITYIDLPEGVWIQDYYLYINNIKKKALLAEKKSVLWAYQMIKNERKDPGIMYYINNKTIAFKIFPFLKYEKRKTGFKLVHLEPLKITNNKEKINLEIEPNLTAPIYSDNKNILYIPQKVKNNLEKIKRTPYYHFIIDCSKNSINSKNKYLKSINSLLAKNLISSDNAKFTLTGYETETYYINELEKKLLDYNNKGGFFLDRALKEILFNNYLNKNNSFPVLVILTDDIDHAVYNNNIINLMYTLPDTNYFYELTNDSKLMQHNLNDFNPHNKNITNTIFQQYVSVFNDNIKISDNNNASIIYNNTKNLNDFSFNENEINNLLTLNSLIKWGFLHTDKTEKNWKKIYFNSISMNTLSFYTSFVVFENQAQEKRMLKKQENVLKSKNFLDAGEKMEEEMPEPSLIIMCILILAVFLIKRSRKKRIN